MCSFAFEFSYNLTNPIQHGVLPKGKLRYGLTGRYIKPELLNKTSEKRRRNGPVALSLELA